MSAVRILLLLSVLLYCVFVRGDLGYYEESAAVVAGNDFLNSYEIFVATCEYVTSQSYLSGTNDTVYATFVGDFSSSGPHNIGNFTVGSTDVKPTLLSRPIGDLKSILFQKDGYDGWLLSTLRCSINSRQYELGATQQWLDNFDLAQYNELGNGYEPDSVLDLSELPASAKMEYLVTSTYFEY